MLRSDGATTYSLTGETQQQLSVDVHATSYWQEYLAQWLLGALAQLSSQRCPLSPQLHINSSINGPASHNTSLMQVLVHVWIFMQVQPIKWWGEGGAGGSGCRLGIVQEEGGAGGRGSKHCCAVHAGTVANAGVQMCSILGGVSLQDSKCIHACDYTCLCLVHAFSHPP